MNWWHFPEDLNLIGEGFEQAELSDSLLVDFTSCRASLQENEVLILQVGGANSHELLIDESWLTGFIIVNLLDDRVNVDADVAVVVLEEDLLHIDFKYSIEHKWRQRIQLCLQELVEAENRNRLNIIKVLSNLMHIEPEVGGVWNDATSIDK